MRCRRYMAVARVLQRIARHALSRASAGWEYVQSGTFSCFDIWGMDAVMKLLSGGVALVMAIWAIGAALDGDGTVVQSQARPLTENIFWSRYYLSAAVVFAVLGIIETRTGLRYSICQVLSFLCFAEEVASTSTSTSTVAKVLVNVFVLSSTVVVVSVNMFEILCDTWQSYKDRTDRATRNRLGR
ncbi:TRP C-terminal domain-containing protein [Plasmodiophora brassicae]|uniref:Uncharacterized protein n=1 Tax=Plasmodiophora brassicae TaxID=37360 RepID=A0A3P3YGP2_PLABS|nr:unnamed protein product [Plasmodiophora brassicae]